jgi:hypothetical protein
MILSIPQVLGYGANLHIIGELVDDHRLENILLGQFDLFQ